LPVPITSPISSSIQTADDQVSLRFSGNHATESHDPAGAWELEFFARFVDRAAQEVIAMKLIIVALATMFALSGAALAGDFSTDGLNGATLGKSMRGVNNGVPYPNTNAAHGTVGSAGGRYYGAPTHHRHHKHYRHYGHHRHH
jgi:hypothetical protein